MKICAWIPYEWKRIFNEEEKNKIKKNSPDLVLIPEGHTDWKYFKEWKKIAKSLETAFYMGFEKDGEQIGVFYNPETNSILKYTKHTTANRIAFQQNDWSPYKNLQVFPFQDINISPSICHDHYISLLTWYQNLKNSQIILNISGEAVKRRKWGEILQARAIENSSYVVCTMHGLRPNGKKGRNNKAHVFAFDPHGKRLRLKELKTGEFKSDFETKPGNLYTVSLNFDLCKEAETNLKNKNTKLNIDRIRKNSKTPSESKKTLKILTDDNYLQLKYQGEQNKVEEGYTILKNQKFSVVKLEGNDILDAGKVSKKILSIDNIKDKTIIIHNKWEKLTESYLRNVIEPVIRARTLEWCSPAIVNSPNQQKGYQLANKVKDTQRIKKNKNGIFLIKLKTAFGINSALKPINNISNLQKRINMLLSIYKEGKKIK